MSFDATSPRLERAARDELRARHVPVVSVMDLVLVLALVDAFFPGLLPKDEA